MVEALHKPPRMRGIKQAIEELRSADPNTAFTESALRRLILNGDLPSVRCGTKYLVNMDALENYLRDGSCSTNLKQLSKYGNLRVVSEKCRYN